MTFGTLGCWPRARSMLHGVLVLGHGPWTRAVQDESQRGGDKGREGGERGWRWATGERGARGPEEILTFYDPLGRGDIHGIRKNTFYHGIQSFTVGGNIHGIRKKNFIMGYDPLGWGRGHSWNQEEETLSWHTRGGGFGGPPPI